MRLSQGTRDQLLDYIDSREAADGQQICDMLLQQEIAPFLPATVATYLSAFPIHSTGAVGLQLVVVRARTETVMIAETDVRPGQPIPEVIAQLRRAAAHLRIQALEALHGDLRMHEALELAHETEAAATQADRELRKLEKLLAR